MIKESSETSQLSFRLSVNAEDIHLGPGTVKIYAQKCLQNSAE